MFENLDKLNRVKCPVFIAHGAQDDVIASVHSQVSIV